MWKAVLVALQAIWKWIAFKSRVEAKLDDITRRLLRLEIDRAIEREDVRTVYELGDVYLGLGYNSYMSEMIKDFKKKHPIKARFKE